MLQPIRDHWKLACKNVLKFLINHKEEVISVKYYTYQSTYCFLTLGLDRNFREKKKGGKRKEGKGKEGKRNGREIALVCIGGNEKERKRDRSFPFKSFQLWIY